MDDDKDRIWIREEEEGERLDKILAQRFKEIHSRSYFQMLIDEHLVLLNGVPIKKRVKPQVGDEVEIQFALTPEIDLTPEPIPLEILYEDPYLIVVNKPAGMVVHPAPGNWTGTFVNALLYHCRQLPVEEGSLRPGIVHRLDKDTSGVLVAAKTTAAHQRLTAMFAGREIYKEYLGICAGNPGNAHIDAAIRRHPVHRQKMSVAEEGGKEALTKCQTLAADGQLSVVKLVIMTGRTHQIRVHMQHRGTPILGDPVYGNDRLNKQHQAEHQLLHAHVLRFMHPFEGKEMEFIAPIPDAIAKMIQKIER